MEAKLVIVSGAANTGEFSLKLPTVIGRSRKVDLPLGHALVSRQHCKLFEVDGVLKLKDLGSLNGTFVDNQRITEETVLLPGAQFTVGPVTFRAVYGDMSATDELSDFGEIADFTLPSGENDEDQLSSAALGGAEISGPSVIPAHPSSEAPPQPAAAESGSQRAPSAASELATEALKPPSEAFESADSFSIPDSPADFGAPQFDWLEQSTSGPPGAASEGDTSENLDFVLGDSPSNTPSVGADQTVQIDPPAKEAAATTPAKREAKKQPAKSPARGLFSRGAKPEKKNQPAQEKPSAEPAATPAKEEQPAAAKPAPVDELDFTLPPAEHEGASPDSSLKNTLDFLN